MCPPLCARARASFICGIPQRGVRIPIASAQDRGDCGISATLSLGGGDLGPQPLPMIETTHMYPLLWVRGGGGGYTHPHHPPHGHPHPHTLRPRLRALCYIRRSVCAGGREAAAKSRQGVSPCPNGLPGTEGTWVYPPLWWGGGPAPTCTIPPEGVPMPARPAEHQGDFGVFAGRGEGGLHCLADPLTGLQTRVYPPVCRRGGTTHTRPISPRHNPTSTPSA